MKVFLIIVAVLAVIISLVLSLSAEFTVIFDNGWSTKIKVLFIEKDIKLSKLLSFLVAPEKAAQEVSLEIEEKKKQKQSEKNTEVENKNSEEKASSDKAESEKNSEEKQEKPNFIKKIIDDDGIAGLMLFVSNLIETANSAVLTLIKGLHIYSLYVKMIIGGGDAADIAQKYGSMCGLYYPVKGLVLTSMKVEQYDDLIVPDFIAPSSEYEFQIIASISVGLLLKAVLKAGKVFLVNLVKSK